MGGMQELELELELEFWKPAGREYTTGGSRKANRRQGPIHPAADYLAALYQGRRKPTASTRAGRGGNGTKAWAGDMLFRPHPPRQPITAS